jgi:hypothetical protein
MNETPPGEGMTLRQAALVEDPANDFAFSEETAGDKYNRNLVTK